MTHNIKFSSFNLYICNDHYRFDDNQACNRFNELNRRRSPFHPDSPQRGIWLNEQNFTGGKLFADLLKVSNFNQGFY